MEEEIKNAYGNSVVSFINGTEVHQFIKRDDMTTVYN
jgi:hypothetical protein